MVAVAHHGRSGHARHRGRGALDRQPFALVGGVQIGADECSEVAAEPEGLEQRLGQALGLAVAMTTGSSSSVSAPSTENRDKASRARGCQDRGRNAALGARGYGGLRLGP